MRDMHLIKDNLLTLLMCFCSQFESLTHPGTDMPIYAVALMVVSISLTLVQLDYGVVHAGGPPTRSARESFITRHQLIDRHNHGHLTVVPDGFPVSRRLIRAVGDFTGKRRRKFVYETRHSGRGLVIARRLKLRKSSCIPSYLHATLC